MKIGIAEDHPLYRESLVTRINELKNFNIVFEIGDGAKLCEHVLKFQPDILLLDIRMPIVDGITALARLLMKGHFQKVIFISSYADQIPNEEIELLGIDAFLSKNADSKELHATLLKVHSSEKCMPKLNSPLAKEHLLSLSKSILTDTESKIVTLLENDKSNKEIAQQLKISQRTVDAHKYNILKKTSSQNLAAVSKKLARYVRKFF